MKNRIPIILDTDIGCDIDDTWAQVMLMRSPEFDLKLVTTAFHDTTYKAKLCAKMFDIAGIDNIPIGIGINTGNICRHIEDWVSDYDLSSYPIVHEDGIGAMIDTIMSSDEPITIIALGPATNLAAAVKRCPEITKRSRILGMFGHISDGDKWIESNIRTDVEAYKTAIEQSDWEIEMIPLEISGSTHLTPERFSYVKSHAETDPLIAALMENSDIWYKNMGFEFTGGSSCLFDTTGIYAAITHDNLNFEDLPVLLRDDNVTVIDPAGKMMSVARTWDDKERFYDYMIKRVCGEI
ncbi:MAG: hypothetical protein E7578_07515 [Ruminococcaceae bacterium]|nr:hypothetical protein [Oscillospiraceae bacterium]